MNVNGYNGAFWGRAGTVGHSDIYPYRVRAVTVVAQARYPFNLSLVYASSPERSARIFRGESSMILLLPAILRSQGAVEDRTLGAGLNHLAGVRGRYVNS